MNIETIEKEGNPESIWGLKTAKDFRGYMQGKINHFMRFETPYCKENEMMLRSILKVYEHFHPLGEKKAQERLFMHEIEIIEGWKGKDNLEALKGFNNDFMIKCHLKDKETGEVKEILKEIKKEDLNKMIWVINKLPKNESVKCYQIAEMMGWVSWKELWKERKQYFKQYYYPIKVLEALKVITYSGRGDIVRII